MELCRKPSRDLTEGPFLKKIILFSIPIILTGLLQCFYNAADVAVIGFFRGQEALAAVGSTVSLNNVTVNLFMGISVGAGVLVAQAVGAKNEKRMGEVLHSAILLAFLLGVAVAVFGFVCCPWLLRLMDTPENVMDGAVLYLRIIFCGAPAMMVYNYSAAMIRSSGDSKRPLVFLSISGLLNVVLNVILVVLFGMGVEGVAIATVAAQVLSVIMSLRHLHRKKGGLHFSFRRLRMNGSVMGRILYLGIPSGIQSSLLSLSNVFLQSSLNAFGDVVVAANSAANNLESFVYTTLNGVSQSAQTFAGQSVGAKKYKNLPKILLATWFFGIVLAAFGCALFLGFREFFIGLYAPNNFEVLKLSASRMMVMLPFSFLVATQGIVSNVLIGMGKSIFCMMNSLVGYCVLRIAWIQFIFPKIGTLASLYYAHPISWLFVTTVGGVAFLIFYRRLLRANE